MAAEVHTSISLAPTPAPSTPYTLFFHFLSLFPLLCLEDFLPLPETPVLPSEKWLLGLPPPGSPPSLPSSEDRLFLANAHLRLDPGHTSTVYVLIRVSVPLLGCKLLGG